MSGACNKQSEKLTRLNRGKVFVFSGILPICDGEDGLATVLGHEIAHNVAHHAAERMSQMLLLVVCLYPLAYLLGAPDFLSQVVMDFGFVRPGSRKQEVSSNLCLEASHADRGRPR